ncbi:hypothetical protein RhiirC2_804100 [Rhizophagus irregularis]|uniref:Uncharacterized protein n=1 Tax=Rhizophagus irregularis TaxID=588596 RepID=A0A2N1L4L8_9GLOM|nr:hypothetical protein RhiirC2_804100 [Rhizophagus irregularis]
MCTIIKIDIDSTLNEKFSIIIAFFQLQNSAFRILVDDRDDFTSNTSEIPNSDKKDEILNKPMEIDFIQKKNPVTNVITAKCKIKHLVILGAVIDPSTNFAIMTDDISKRSKLKIDTKEKYDFKDTGQKLKNQAYTYPYKKYYT